jgi:hypothetical protein
MGVYCIDWTVEKIRSVQAKMPRTSGGKGLASYRSVFMFNSPRLIMPISSSLISSP